MTYPNYSPVSPEEIDKRLKCDPEIMGLNFRVYSGRAFCLHALGKDTHRYVQKITAHKEVDVMEDLDNGKPP
ncbi:hypothetical protein Pfo_004769 [Paulownia fortunei]|nr:hypothetical protein Pfo_004769 [Paulownia fortunei]